MIYKKKWCHMICVVLIMIFCLVLTCNAWGEASSQENATSVQQKDTMAILEGKMAGVMTGTPQDTIVKNNVKNTKLQYFNNATDMALALQKKKIDFMALSSVNYYSMAEEYPELAYIKQPLTSFEVGTIFPKTQKADGIRGELNAYIAQIKQNGKLEELQNYWLYPNNWENIDIPEQGEKGTLKLATANTLKPFSFMLNDKNVGFDIAVIAGFCKEYGYGLQIENVDFDGILSGITTGKYDLAAGQISWTEERAESVNYSDFYYTQEIVAIVNSQEFVGKADLVSGNSAQGSASATADHSKSPKCSYKNSIQKTLLQENRWVSIVKGLAVTLEITFMGFLLANILGAVLCAMAMSKIRAIRILAGMYSGLMQGLPIVVILMILYYIVFGHSRISNVLVAIIGFGMVFAAYMAQVFEGNIRGVEKGQWEAAYTIGLTKRQTFMGVILPQAIRRMLPAYFSNFISLMKGTAIVGYIAITDLTKVGDIIRSSTYEAFVPLLTVAMIYLLLASILLLIMQAIRSGLLRKRVCKKSRKRERREK